MQPMRTATAARAQIQDLEWHGTARHGTVRRSTAQHSTASKEATTKTAALTRCLSISRQHFRPPLFPATTTLLLILCLSLSLSLSVCVHSLLQSSLIDGPPTSLPTFIPWAVGLARKQRQ